MLNQPLTLFVAPHTEMYRWSVDLYWYVQKKLYAEEAKDTTYIAIIKRNKPYEPKNETVTWNIDIPHKLVETYYDYDLSIDKSDGYFLPINIQYGIIQILHDIDDEQIIELIECDMFHLIKTPPYQVDDDTIITDNIYENWHLKSTTDHSRYVRPFLKDKDLRYTGGFFPIIIKAKTLKRLITPWINAHIDLLKTDIAGNQRWWAGMYALQIACQNENIKMLNENLCYIPGINEIEGKRICHYSVDQKFNKKEFPNIDINNFPYNSFYNTVKDWFINFV